MVNQSGTNFQALKAAFCLLEGRSRVQKCPLVRGELERVAKHLQKCLASAIHAGASFVRTRHLLEYC